MEGDSRSRWQGKGSLEELLRELIRGTIELIVEQELEATIGAASSQRIGDQRTGYRHGHRGRTLSTSLGATTIAMPRASIEGEDRQRHWREHAVTNAFFIFSLTMASLSDGRLPRRDVHRRNRHAILRLALRPRRYGTRGLRSRWG
jgi:hypothetical protein